MERSVPIRTSPTANAASHYLRRWPDAQGLGVSCRVGKRTSIHGDHPEPVLRGDRRGEPGRGAAPTGDGPDTHAAPGLPELLGRCDAGGGLLPHVTRSGAAGVGRDAALGGGGLADLVLPRAVLRVPPS